MLHNTRNDVTESSIITTQYTEAVITIVLKYYKEKYINMDDALHCPKIMIITN